jgi:PhzF family phenazine biosynthesis protein
LTLPLHQIDAFSGTPFAGNPAAVCLLDRVRPDAWMQAVAAEMNLSETAFLEPLEHGYRLRWFTPALEVDLCGHATLASAHFLYEGGHVAPEEEVRFTTTGGDLVVRRDGDQLVMRFPIDIPEPSNPPAKLVEALGVAPLEVVRGRYDVVLRLEDEAAVRAADPDFRALASVGTRGAIITAEAEAEGVDFVSRFFAPAAGIDEDPVTGSAHCLLGPYWAGRLGKPKLRAHQASVRGGELGVKVQKEHVLLSGRAVTAWRGELCRAALGDDG